MALGGTLEQLATPIVVDNGFGGTDTLTHHAWGIWIDPFSPGVEMIADANVATSATVTMYTGKPVGGKAFKTYPGIPSRVAMFNGNELKDLNQQNKYTIIGLIEAAKVKLGVS